MRELWDTLEDELGAKFAYDKQLQSDIRRLSRGFTEERGELDIKYLSDVRLRSAYLAYYVPLNFHKVRVIIEAHSRQLWPSVPETEQRWVDFGCGPAATGTLAALAVLKTRAKNKLPKITIDLVDNQHQALDLAEGIVIDFAERLGIEVSVNVSEKTPKKSYDLAIAANVLNELPPEDGSKARDMLLDLWDKTEGTLVVLEPGHRVSSQRLVRFRERLLKETPKGETNAAEVLGPCAHAETCPVYRTKNWCHFSEPGNDDRLREFNLAVFQNPRGWLKFSYFIVKRGKSTVWDKKTFRAIGDLHMSQGRTAIDLCKPNTKYQLRLPMHIPTALGQDLVRGAMVTLEGETVKRSVPMSVRVPKPVSKPRSAVTPNSKRAVVKPVSKRAVVTPRGESSRPPRKKPR